MTEKEKTYRIRKLVKDCYRRMKMLNNICAPPFMSIDSLTHPFHLHIKYDSSNFYCLVNGEVMSKKLMPWEMKRK